MLRRALASCLSSLLAFLPLLASVARAQEAPIPLKVRVDIARKAYKKSYLAATLGTIPDVDKLRKEYELLKAPPPGPELMKSWRALQKSSAEFDLFKSRFLAFTPRQLKTKLGELGLALGIPRDELLKAFPAVLPRYQALQERLTVTGVYWDAKRGVFANPDGAVDTDKFLPPQLTPDIDARIDKLNFKLIEIHQLAKAKKFDEAAARFTEIVDGLGGQGDAASLLEQGLGSLGMETTLSLVNETYKLLSGDEAKKSVSAENQARLASSVRKVDTRLAKIANKKIVVPIPGSGSRAVIEKSLSDEPVSLATKFKLATFAAMSELPIFSGWAKEKFFHLQTAEIMRGNKDIKSYSFKRWDPTWDPNDPEHKKRPRYRLGVEMVYKDKTIYESRDHQLLIVTDTRARTVIIDDTRYGYHKKTVNGKVFYEWKRDEKTGGQVGVFRESRFRTTIDEKIFFTDGGNTMVVAEGKTSEGVPKNPLRFYSHKQRGYYLPDGKGTIVTSWGEGGVHRDLFLDDKVLKEWARTGKLDLSFIDGLPEDVKREIDRKTLANLEAYKKFLHDLPQFGGLFEAAVNGDSMEYTSGKHAVKKRNYLSRLYFRDGVLNVVMGEEGTSTGPDRKTGKVGTRNWKDDSAVTFRVVVDREGGKKVMKAFLFMGDSKFMYKFNEDFTKWDEYGTDSKVFVEEGGRIEFVLRRKSVKRGGKWVMTENHPAEMKEWTTWDSIKAGGMGALSGLGTAVEVVLSPISTALDGILGSIHLAAGGMLSLFEGTREFATFEKISGMYTIRQAKFNEWFGNGTHAKIKTVVKNGKSVKVVDHGPVLDSYRQAMNLVGDKDMRDMVNNFLDGEIEKAAKIRWGELWRFHKDDPITTLDRAYMAAGTFGYANLAAQYFAQGREAWERGDYAGGVVGYGLGGTYIAVRAFAEVAGLGIATTPLKIGVAAMRTGKTYKEVSTLLKAVGQAKKAGTAVKLTEAQQVILKNVSKTLNTLSYGEMAFYLTPAGGQFIVDGVGMVNAVSEGDTEGKWRHFNGMFSTVSAFAGIIGGVKIANKVAQMRVRYDVKHGKNVLPKGYELIPRGPGKKGSQSQGKAGPKKKTVLKDPVKESSEKGPKAVVEKVPKEAVVEKGSKEGAETGKEPSGKGKDVVPEALKDPERTGKKGSPKIPVAGSQKKSSARPSGKITIESNGKTEVLEVTFDRKPRNMEATFMGKDSNGRSVVMKGEEYIGVSSGKKTRAPGELTPMQREASIILQVSRLVEQAKSDGVIPQNVSVPEVIGLGTMDAALAKQVYGRARPVEILVLARAEGVNMQSWLGRGKELDLGGYNGVKDLVRFLHRNGLIHGDLNPGNILLHQRPNGEQHFTLVDFGASKRFSSNKAVSEIPANRVSDFKMLDMEMLVELEGYFKDAGKIRTGVLRQSPVVPKTTPAKPTPAKLSALRERVIGKKLPGADKAVLDMRKFTEYMLNKSHPKGGSKARYMEEALGYTKADAAKLMQIFKEQVKIQKVESIEFNGNKSGYLFVVLIEVPGIGPKAGRTLPLKTVWNINPGATAPTFVTAYRQR